MFLEYRQFREALIRQRSAKSYVPLVFLTNVSFFVRQTSIGLYGQPTAVIDAVWPVQRH